MTPRFWIRLAVWASLGLFSGVAAASSPDANNSFSNIDCQRAIDALPFKPAFSESSAWLATARCLSVAGRKTQALEMLYQAISEGAQPEYRARAYGLAGGILGDLGAPELELYYFWESTRLLDDELTLKRIAASRATQVESGFKESWKHPVWGSIEAWLLRRVSRPLSSDLGATAIVVIREFCVFLSRAAYSSLLFLIIWSAIRSKSKSYDRGPLAAIAIVVAMYAAQAIVLAIVCSVSLSQFASLRIDTHVIDVRIDIALVVVWCVTFVLLARPKMRDSTGRTTTPLATAGWATLAVVVTLFLWFGVTALSSSESVSWDDSSVGLNEGIDPDFGARNSLWFVVLFFVAAAAAEEVVFRGVLYSALKQALGVPVGIFASSLLFALVHIYSLWSTAASFVFGVVAAWLVERTGRVSAAICLHLAMNLILYAAGT